MAVPSELRKLATEAILNVPQIQEYLNTVGKNRIAIARRGNPNFLQPPDTRSDKEILIDSSIKELTDLLQDMLNMWRHPNYLKSRIRVQVLTDPPKPSNRIMIEDDDPKYGFNNTQSTLVWSKEQVDLLFQLYNAGTTAPSRLSTEIFGRSRYRDEVSKHIAYLKRRKLL